jgi:hypothetical protein
MNFLSGKKTYIVAFGVVVAAIVSFLTGEMTLAQAVAVGLEGTGLATLRAGVASTK